MEPSLTETPWVQCENGSSVNCEAILLLRLPQALNADVFAFVKLYIYSYWSLVKLCSRFIHLCCFGLGKECCSKVSLCTTTFSINWADSSHSSHSAKAYTCTNIDGATTANKLTTPRTTLFSKEKRKSCPGWDSNPRHSAVTLQSRRALYLLSYQGNSVGRSRNLQHKAKWNYTIPPSHTRQTKSTIPPLPPV